MTAQLVMARNVDHRGWRHEGAVTMPTKEEREESASVVEVCFGIVGRWWWGDAAFGVCCFFKMKITDL